MNEESSRPVWYGDEDAGKFNSIMSDPEILIERARFIGSFPHVSPVGEERSKDGKYTYSERERSIEEGAFIYLLIQARDMRTAPNMQDWREGASSYPTPALMPEELSRSSPDVAVRSHFAYEAIARLLELSGAPHEMCEDFQTLVKRQRPRSAEKRALAQEQILKTPTASMRKIASDTGYNVGEISRDLKKRYLIWPR